MKAYWVARSKIINKVNYKKYTDLVPSIIKKYKENDKSRSSNTIGCIVKRRKVF